MLGNSTKQFIKFMILSLTASAVELLTFWLFNFWVFKSLATRPFNWFLFDYPVANGGLCAFLAFAFSFFCAQVTNFFVQRHFTFKSKSNAAKSAVLYAVMVCATYIYVLWLPSVISSFFYSSLGTKTGAFAIKLVCQFTSAVIQFPLNKFVVMR